VGYPSLTMVLLSATGLYDCVEGGSRFPIEKAVRSFASVMGSRCIPESAQG
jgi:hypothetical protein